MPYPYGHRTRKTESECYAFKPLGPDDGAAVGGSASNLIADMATIATYTVNPLYGTYTAAIHAWAEGAATSNITIKVRPWVDHGQTIPGAALKMFQIGSSTLVTTVTLAATSLKAGNIWQLIPGNSGAGANPGSVAIGIGPISHGLAVTVDRNGNTAGKLDFELVLQRSM